MVVEKLNSPDFAQMHSQLMGKIQLRALFKMFFRTFVKTEQCKMVS